MAFVQLGVITRLVETTYPRMQKLNKTSVHLSIDRLTPAARTVAYGNVLKGYYDFIRSLVVASYEWKIDEFASIPLVKKWR